MAIRAVSGDLQRVGIERSERSTPDRRIPSSPARAVRAEANEWCERASRAVGVSGFEQGHAARYFHEDPEGKKAISGSGKNSSASISGASPPPRIRWRGMCYAATAFLLRLFGTSSVAGGGSFSTTEGGATSSA